MRRPTNAEKVLLLRTLFGLTQDIDALTEEETSDRQRIYDILGTLGVNLTVLGNIRKRLLDEKED